MISLLKILSEINNDYDRVNAVLSSIEPISIDNGENQEINRFVQQVLEYLPEGVTVDEVSNNLPEDLPHSTVLKVLIKLSQHKLINFIGGNMKMTPMQILKVYGNSKDVVGKEYEFSLNELEINKPSTTVDNIFNLLSKLLFVNRKTSDEVTGIFKKYKFYDPTKDYTITTWLPSQSKEIQRGIYQDLLDITKKYNIS